MGWRDGTKDGEEEMKGEQRREGGGGGNQSQVRAQLF